MSANTPDRCRSADPPRPGSSESHPTDANTPGKSSASNALMRVGSGEETLVLNEQLEIAQPKIEQRWSAEIRRRTEVAERQRRELLELFVCQERDAAALRDQIAAIDIECDQLVEQLRELDSRSAQLRYRVAYIEQLRGELSTWLRDYQQRGERHLTVMTTLLATYRERLTKVEQERATRQATAATEQGECR